ncbi:GL15154 [Drosophila persimilis]|uniref:GL15154 n=2 Tax=Drosophila persimilis TaxID=7234 RepID=B4GPV1_DROPE|nr:GL15154 [Drosophila persimilis]
MAKGYFNLLALMVLSSLLIGSQTAEWQIRYHNPNFPGKCTISPGLVLNGGVSIKDPTHECRQIVCGSDGMTLFHRMLFALKLAIIFGLVLAVRIGAISAAMSINSYENPGYPGRCVIDTPSSVVLLESGQAFKLPNIDCATIFCISNGWGSLFTCENKAPPDDCRFSDALDPNALYPECCKRRVICD